MPGSRGGTAADETIQNWLTVDDVSRTAPWASSQPSGAPSAQPSSASTPASPRNSPTTTRRVTPSVRSRPISPRLVMTETETVLYTRKSPTMSAIRLRAVRLNWNARSMRSTSAPRDEGRRTVIPAGARAAISRSARATSTPPASRTSTRSTRPRRPIAHCAAATSIRAKPPSRTLAGPSSPRTPATRRGVDVSPATSATRSPTRSPWRAVNRRVRTTARGSVSRSRNSSVVTGRGRPPSTSG